MKTIEEKAKAYDEAVDRIKGYVKDEYGCTRLKPSDIFPELAESEDEKIRKELIQMVKLSQTNGDDIDKYISWLKKQGEQKQSDYPYVTGWRENRPDNKPKVKHSVLMFTTHGAVEGEWLGEEWCQYRWSCKVKDTDVLYWMHLSDLERLEKENGEQKPVNTNPHFPNGNIPYDRGFEEAQEYISHRGFDIPWNDCDVFVDERYITQTIANVLTWADEHPKEQKPVEWSEEDTAMLDATISFVNHSSFSTIGKGKKNTLAWLESLKERPQTQLKTEWSEEDKALIENVCTALKGYAYHERKVGLDEHAHRLEEMAEKLKSLKDRILLQPKQEWSIEDDKMINSIAVHLNATTGGFPEDRAWADKFMIWLKSLRPQPKQGLSEDEEGIIATALSNTYSDDIATKLLNRIKSIHPQKQEWSKEDERMIKIVKEMAYTIAQTSDKQFLERHGTNEQELKNWSLSCSPQKQWNTSNGNIDLSCTTQTGNKCINGEDYREMLKRNGV